MIMELFDQYLALQKKIYDYFDYTEDWAVLQIEDRREFYWKIDGGEAHGGKVRFTESRECINDDESMFLYEDIIYTQRHLSKWVYRADDFTMICVDTRTDGKRFLAIFENAKEVIGDFHK
jgi:hypothetical protein